MDEGITIDLFLMQFAIVKSAAKKAVLDLTRFKICIPKSTSSEEEPDAPTRAKTSRFGDADHSRRRTERVAAK